MKGLSMKILAAAVMMSTVLFAGQQAEAAPRCGATIRATGLGNVIPGIARINAIQAWKREVRSVYRLTYKWSDARRRSISCRGVGITTRCTARARPCRY